MVLSLSRLMLKIFIMAHSRPLGEGRTISLVNSDQWIEQGNYPLLNSDQGSVNSEEKSGTGKPSTNHYPLVTIH